MSSASSVAGAAAVVADPVNCETVLPLHAEELVVSRRRVEGDHVRVATVTRVREQIVDEALLRERVEVERVPVGRYVDAVPDVREEAGVTILPVVEEVLVVERRLLLREEVHVRRVCSTERHVETVSLREQEAVITREPASGAEKGAKADQPTEEREP